ncbi:hypothetical protein JW930_00275 [Candidatus Woesearchaeota archaeon]|nr:hypothetical protein [Candidatus Woesearchaeota archaeon]
MPIVAYPLYAFDMEKDCRAGLAFLKLSKINNCSFINIIFTPSFKDEDGKYQRMGQYNIRLPITMLVRFLKIIRLNYGINLKSQNKWKIKTLPGLRK